MKPEPIEAALHIDSAEQPSRVVDLWSSSRPDVDSTTFALQIRPEVTELGLVRRLVSSLVCRGDRESDALYLVAVTEVVTNAIDAHQRAGLSDAIIVTIDPETQVVEVVDGGDGLDGSLHHDRAGDGSSGGGLVLARKLVPELWWRPNEPRGTIVSLPYAVSSVPPSAEADVPGGT